jgi:antitoxin (DNA-binding transcriptional repressor) of toxin-antitoxin stability system
MKDVCHGKSFTITVDGRPVAEVRPSLRGGTDVEAIKVLEELSSPRFEGASDEVIREWLKEEQRHN